MHKFLTKVCSSLVLPTCLLWGILAATYASVENVQQRANSSTTLAHADEGFILQEEDIRRNVVVSPVSAFGGIFSESDNKRNTQDHPSNDLLHSAQYKSIVSHDFLSLFSSVKVSFSIRNRSIYLLYCSFLI